MFQPQHHARIQQSMLATQTTNQRRNPFANAAINHQKTPPKPPQKAPASPPLPRQNSKTTPPSPPKIITDKSGRFQFSRVGFLGEVGGSEIRFQDNGLIHVRRVVLPAFMKSRTQEARVSPAR
jgi:hypothetical protein